MSCGMFCTVAATAVQCSMCGKSGSVTSGMCCIKPGCNYSHLSTVPNTDPYHTLDLTLGYISILVKMLNQLLW